jgi:3',5'-cyclic AMP phosphodiesterase CpdA
LNQYGVGAAYDASTSHVLLVADPQIVDRYSYPNRNFLFAYLTRLIVDLNLRKNWKVAIEKKPDVVVFLGDMMDNGRDSMSDAEWVKTVVLSRAVCSPFCRYESYFHRFQSIFKTDASIPQYFIPGNHDTGCV